MEKRSNGEVGRGWRGRAGGMNDLPEEKAEPELFPHTKPEKVLMETQVYLIVGVQGQAQGSRWGPGRLVRFSKPSLPEMWGSWGEERHSGQS